MLDVVLIGALALGSVGESSMLTDGVKLQGLTGCNATAINVATSCEFRSPFGAFGRKLTPHQYHVLAIYAFFDRDGATGYTFQVQSCIEGMDDTDCTDSTDWYSVDAQTATTHYTDLEPKIYRRTVSADSYDVFLIGTTFSRLRLSNILCTGGGCTANDKITMRVIMHQDAMGFLP
jgi:hypothetical protein